MIVNQNQLPWLYLALIIFGFSVMGTNQQREVELLHRVMPEEKLVSILVQPIDNMGIGIRRRVTRWYRLRWKMERSWRIVTVKVTVRTINVLKAEGIYHIGGLLQMTEEELLNIPNFGEKSLAEVNNWLNLKGLRLGLIRNWPSDRNQETKLIRKLKKKQVSLVLKEDLVSILVRVINEEMTTRTANTLAAEGIYHIGSLLQITEEELLNISNFGKGNLDEVNNWLNLKGLQLGMIKKWPSDRKGEMELINKLYNERQVPLELINISEENLVSILVRVINEEMTTRTANALAAEGIYHVGGLLQMTEEELLNILNFGEKSLTEINNWLNLKGLQLGMIKNWPSDREGERELMDKLEKKQIPLDQLINLPSSPQQVAELVEKLNPVERRKKTRFLFINSKVKKTSVLLTSRQEQILKMRFGIGEPPRTLKEVGEIFNVSSERIRQIQVRSLHKLHHFGNVREIIDVDNPRDLTSKEVAMLMEALNYELTVDNDRCYPYIKI